MYEGVPRSRVGTDRRHVLCARSSCGHRLAGRHADDVALQEAAEDLAGVSDAMHSLGVSVDDVLAELAATPIGVHDYLIFRSGWSHLDGTWRMSRRARQKERAGRSP